MQQHYFETVNALNWGKFMVCKFEGADFAEPAVVDPNQRLLRSQGWGPDHLLVLDLATGEGGLFAVRPNGLPAADLVKHRIWVCPMFEPFLVWLYQQDVSDLGALPRVVDLPDAKMAFAGFRRPGPELGLLVDAVRERLTKYVPCICGPEYTERDLNDPACRHHDAMDAIDELAEDLMPEPDRP